MNCWSLIPSALAVAQPREFDVAEQQVAVLESDDLSCLVPSEAQKRAADLEGVAGHGLEFEQRSRRIVSPNHQAVFAGRRLTVIFPS